MARIGLSRKKEKKKKKKPRKAVLWSIYCCTKDSEPSEGQTLPRSFVPPSQESPPAPHPTACPRTEDEPGFGVRRFSPTEPRYPAVGKKKSVALTLRACSVTSRLAFAPPDRKPRLASDSPALPHAAAGAEEIRDTRAARPERARMRSQAGFDEVALTPSSSGGC